MSVDRDARRTLFLSEIYPPLIGGTANKFSARFAKYREDEVVVVTRKVENSESADGAVDYPIERIDVPHRGLKGFEWASDARQFVRAARRLRREQGFSVVECARPLPEGFAGLILSRLWRVPLVVNVQGEDLSVMRNFRVERWVMRRMLRSARLNIANSRFTEDLIKDFAGHGVTTTVIPPGLRSGIENWISSSEDVAELRASFGGDPVLLTAGRLQARKGHDNVVRALPAIRKSFPNIRYLIVGSDQGGTQNLQDRLSTLAREIGVEENVQIVGMVSNDELATFYAACDLFVMPNRCEPDGDVEGFGQVFLEAGYFGKPVIGGRSGGVPDAIKDGETGVLVDGTSPDEIAEAVMRLLRDPSMLATMGRNGIEFANSLRSESVASRYRDVMLTSLP